MTDERRASTPTPYLRTGPATMLTAIGLCVLLMIMQLMPETQARFGVTRPFDAQQNIRGAMIYLKWLEKQFGPDWVRISAAYNAGEQAVLRHGGVPPYQETQEYVQRVLYYGGHPRPH